MTFFRQQDETRGRFRGGTPDWIPETDSGELFWGGTPGMIPGTDPVVSQCEPPEIALFGGGLQGVGPWCLSASLRRLISPGAVLPQHFYRGKSVKGTVPLTTSRNRPLTDNAREKCQRNRPPDNSSSITTVRYPERVILPSVIERSLPGQLSSRIFFGLAGRGRERVSFP